MYKHITKKLALSLSMGIFMGLGFFITYAATSLISINDTINPGDTLSADWYNDLKTRLTNIYGSGTNVGIGTNSPTQKLDVNGTVKANSFVGNGSTITAINPANIGAGTGGISITGNAATATNATNATNSTNATTATTAGNGVPAGAIMPFNLSSCPTGWIAANGASGTPDLRGEFIRGLDSGRGVDPSRTLASSQAATRVFHYEIDDAGWAGRQVDLFQTVGSNYDGSIELVTNISSANSLASGAGTIANAKAYGIRVRPRNVALLYCVKQ